jgi:hypothetical protein
LTAAAAIERALGRLLRRRRAGEAKLAWFDPRLAGLPPTLILESPAFADGGAMPARSAAKGVGDNLSPALRWSGAPAATRAFMLIVEDPDAPTPRPIVHALALDIPADRVGVAEGALAPGADPGFALGRGAFGRVGWSGPRPIAGHGPHAYVFQLVALARPLGLDATASLAEALAAMAGAALARGRLTGFYERL